MRVCASARPSNSKYNILQRIKGGCESIGFATSDEGNIDADPLFSSIDADAGAVDMSAY